MQAAISDIGNGNPSMMISCSLVVVGWEKMIRSNQKSV
jgi:hypothetical protein